MTLLLLALWLAAASVLAAQISVERQRLEQSLTQSVNGPQFLLLTLGVAFFLGAAHGLTPGHGKTIVAAYLVGSRGTLWDAVYLGSVVTLTHTSSVFVLGFLTLFASRYILMSRIYPWLSVLSGVLVVGMGIWLLRVRWRAPGEHDHGHAHDPLLPHSHSHESEHSHSHPHSHPHAHDDARPHEHAHRHAHEDAPDHTQDHTHEHTQATASSGVSRWQLLSLGVSGGLVPCPEALVVLLMAVSIHKLGLGLVILVAFSVGLAAVLISIGAAMILAGPLMARLSPSGRILRTLPIGSAVVVTLLGCGIVYKALADSHLLRL